MVTLHFEADQVIFAEHGALLFCPAGGDLVQMALQDAAQLCPYKMLPVTCAMEIVHGAARTGERNSCLDAFRADRAKDMFGLPAAA